MNKKIKLCLFLLSLICLAHGMAVYAEDISVPSWTVSSNDETAEIKLDRNTVKNGSAALYVSTEQTQETQNGKTTKIYQKASELEPSTSYRFSFWGKAEHIEKYTVVRDVFNSVDARANESGTYGWTEKDIDFTTSKSANTAAFQFIIAYGDGNKGEVWIDGVSLYKLENGKPTGNNLILNGDFEEGIDVTPPEEIADVKVMTGDGRLTVSWRDSSSSDLKGINVSVDGVFKTFVNAGEEYCEIENLENGRQYKITLVTEDYSGNKSKGLTVQGVPKKERGVPEVYADDTNDLIVGINEEMEYSIDGAAWVAYADNPQPLLQGCHLVKVRYKESETESAGKYKVILFFKADKTPESNMAFSASVKVDEVAVQGTAPVGSTVRIMARAADNPDTIVFVREIAADDDGNFTQKFYMPYTAPAGHYLLRCKADDTIEAEAVDLIYTDRESLNELIARLKVSSETEILSILSSKQDGDKLISLGVRMNDFSRLNSVNKRSTAAEIYAKRATITENNLDEIINSQIALGLIGQSKNSGEVLGILFTYQQWLNLSMRGVPFDKVTDNELIAWICEKVCGKSFGSRETFAAYYQKQCAFYILNGESYVNLGTVMNGYQKELELENESVYMKYVQLSAAEQETVNRKVKLANSFYDDTNTLMTAVNQAMNALSTGSGNSGTAGGGNSGNGGGGSKTAISSSIDVFDSSKENISENETKKIFDDLGSVPWAEKAILSLAERGVLSGVEKGVFEPDGLVTREQLAVMTAKAFGISSASTEETPFTDVEQDRWSYPQINVLKQSGLINGYEDGTFLPQNNISREDMVLILYRTLIQIMGAVEKSREFVDFSDWDEVSGYAEESVREMYCMGFVNGVSNTEFAPQGTATRAMAAKILYDMIERIGE